LNDNRKRSIRRVEIVLFIIVVIWGINTPVMKMGLLALKPLLYNACRLLLAAALALLALVLTKSYKAMPMRDIKQLASISIFGFFFNQVLVIFGMSQTTAGNASLVLATLPVEVALINRLFKIELISRQTAMGIVIGLLGVFFVVWGSNKEFSLFGPHMIGAALLLMGQACYAYYTVFSKQLINQYSIYQIIAFVMTTNAILFSLMALPELEQLQLGDISGTAWYSIIFSATFALFMANFVWVWVVGILGSTTASLYQYLCPVLSIAFASVFMNESFSILQCMGAAVTFLGLYLTRS